MPVKHWSFAGLMLTYWCNARCESCYVCCGPKRREEMSIDFALRVWRELTEASPHGCRIHLSGGEPFGNWERLIELCRRAHREKLGPLEKVETNAFWATSARIVRERLAALDAAGMGKLTISADPYHQQYIPIDRCRLAARAAEEVLGPGRLQVRWRDWLVEGFDTSALDRAERSLLFARYAAQGRDRMIGRAANMLTTQPQRKSAEQFADSPCWQRLLRSRHVHVGPDGRVMPGTCAGIVLGVAPAESVGGIWRRLGRSCLPGPTNGDAKQPSLAVLVREGPVGLIETAGQAGFVPAAGYADKCHLCWDIRRSLAGVGRFQDVFGPKWLYESQ